MLKTMWFFVFLMFFLVLTGSVMSQTEEVDLSKTIREYTVKRTSNKIVIDGRLDEQSWRDAEFTEHFVIYTDGSKPKFPAQGKMLWDNNYLYVAFIMTDEDVWGKMTSWKPGDPCLCSEEVAEVFIDPDGDGFMYIEVEINPLKTVMDLTLDKEFSKGGKGNLEWTLKGLKVGVSVEGTLNSQKDVDKRWICELAFPFKNMAFSAPTRNFPPKHGDWWRINLYRYDYGRTEEKLTELTAWNMTDNKRGFHAPDRFGKIVFSEANVSKQK